MNAPEPLMNTSSQLSMVQVADISMGMVVVVITETDGSDRGPLCAKDAERSGRLGPEMCFVLEQLQITVTLANIDQQPGHEIVTVQSRNGRVLVSRVGTRVRWKRKRCRLACCDGIGPAGASRDRAAVATDIDGDKLMDLVIANPDGTDFVCRKMGINELARPEVCQVYWG